MTPISIVFLVLSATLVWGGLIVSAVHLTRHPEPAEFPPGGEDDARPEHTVVEHDT